MPKFFRKRTIIGEKSISGLGPVKTERVVRDTRWMIDAPPGESSVLVFILNVSMQRPIRLKASHDVTERRVDIGLGKGARGAARGRGRGMGAGRRGADIAMGRGGGESNDVVGEGVGEGSGGQGAGVPFRVDVIEEKGRTDGGWRQAEEG